MRLNLRLRACLPRVRDFPRHQVEGWVFEGPWGRVRLRGAAGFGEGVWDRKKAGLKVMWLIERQQPQISLRPLCLFPSVLMEK